jgi:hypothetical protein
MGAPKLHLQLKDLLRTLGSIDDPNLGIVVDEHNQTLILHDEESNIAFTVELIGNTEYILSFPLSDNIPKSDPRFPNYLLSLLSTESLIPRRLDNSSELVSYGVAMAFRWDREDTKLERNFYHALERLRGFKDEFYDELLLFLIENGLM